MLTFEYDKWYVANTCTVYWNNIIRAAVNTRQVRFSALIFPNIILSQDQYSSGEVSNASLDNNIQM